MEQQDKFRLFYNQTIHPELRRMERQRKRLLFLLAGSCFLLIGVFAIERYINIPVLTLFMLIPIGCYIFYLMYRVRKFVQQFKPNVVKLILDFIDDDINYGTFSYDAKKYIPKPQFLSSLIFNTPALEYRGEDYIKGKVGELDFEMCELNVRELSRVRNRLNYVFKGVFMHAQFNTTVRGGVLILPKKFKQFLIRTIKHYTKYGGELIEPGILERRFENVFITYATHGAAVKSLLSKEMQHAILDYREVTENEIYLSFLEDQLYVAVTEPKNILEPYILRSNVDFELIKEFYDHIQLFVSIVEDVDRHH